MTPALELRQLGKQIGPTTLVRGVDLRVAAGERLALIGPNGAGKSTLFNLMSGVLTPSSGQIWLNGQRIDGLPPHRINRRGLSRSFQVSNLFTGLSVWDNLRCGVLWSLGYRYTLWRWLSGLDDANQRTQTLLNQLELNHRRDTLARHLSYAEQRALELGITLASGAGVILLDEPTAGMNHSETAHFTRLIRTLTHGKTLLMVEHDMGVVFDLADRIAVLVQGELLTCDTPAAVRADARVQAAYWGQLDQDGAAAVTGIATSLTPSALHTR